MKTYYGKWSSPQHPPGGWEDTKKFTAETDFDAKTEFRAWIATKPAPGLNGLWRDDGNFHYVMIDHV